MKTNIRISSETKVCILTGAGISAESGLKTFRDNNGLWENHRVEEVATPQAFAKDPEMVWKFYKQRYYQALTVKPNQGHEALVSIEKNLGKNFLLITQNVDGLHTLAGNNNVLEMHGALRRCFCSNCGAKFNMKDVELSPSVPVCPRCSGSLRPDIVWFGEMPYFLEEIDSVMKNTDYFIVIGTGGTVYPAAQFLSIVKYFGAKTIGVNKEKPQNYGAIDEFHEGKAGEILPELVKIWFS
jgi:NAD-dependent deacetylase